MISCNMNPPYCPGQNLLVKIVPNTSQRLTFEALVCTIAQAKHYHKLSFIIIALCFHVFIFQEALATSVIGQLFILFNMNYLKYLSFCKFYPFILTLDDAYSWCVIF